MTATILVVDDSAINLKLIEDKLLSEYYIVLKSSSPLEALELIDTYSIDVILLDIMMPELNGFEFCLRVRSAPQTSHIPIIMVTALYNIQDRVRGLEVGADEFLTKPVNDLALFTRVKSLVRIKMIIDELKIRSSTRRALGIGSKQLLDLKHEYSDSTILVIDDDLVQIKYITKSLEHVYDAISILNKISNLDYINDIPDLIIVSCQIDFIDPLRLVGIIRSKEKFKNSVLMMLGEDASMHIIMKAMELGINDYFIYPVDASELQARIRTQLRRKFYQDQLKQEINESFNLSTKDGLTGVFNRRYFDSYISSLIQDCKQLRANLSIIMIDIDDFKEVNDKYGHQSGDAILQQLISNIADNIRVTDLLARYGGEEFIIVLDQTLLDEAVKVADNIRNIISNTKFILPKDNIEISKTISIGIAQYRHQESLISFIDRADSALYQAKFLGKNRLIVN
ncbi:PleD family two-component system response regulator [Rickettsia endosymbiont of Cardiosporidium cionae]|uniref:PleD family two-component system response regulator n=1 Tax=Rickettsia endosymbiont of Cardiosporidium cionae TaxID=2777155 RepID=UPI00189604AD|nr:PleD family two-component system response regulator [Rickettsia endosymbiont of Cardiosporidium cionae]KAF8818673.1 PleD family two-component system response regulator [Rickettsia endosymbiont of Cardiosporidium cionae]